MADAISGRYEADFSQYKSETQSAAAQLRLFEDAAVKATAAVGRVTTTAPEGFAQFGVTALNTRKEMAAMESAARTTTSTFSTLGRSLSDADKTLALMGVHVGPEIKALEELGSSAGKSVTSLGALSTAGLALGAGIAGWKIGRAVADFFDLDNKVVALTDHILGLGVAEQTAGAIQDTIDRAVKDGADSHIQYAEAVQFNIKHQKEFGESLNTSQHRLSLWQGEIRKVRSEGMLAALEADIKSGNSTIAEMAAQYGITERAVQYFTRTLDEHSRAQDQVEASARKAADAIKAEQERVDQAVAAEKSRIADVGATLYGAKDIKAADDLAAAIGSVSEATKLAAVNATGAAAAADALWKAEQILIAQAVATGAALPPVVELYERLRMALTANARAELDDAAATAANTAEKKRLNEEMERAFTASGGTDVEGFREGIVSTGQSHMQPFVGLKPSVFAGSGIAGVTTPGTLITNTFNVNGTAGDVARSVSDYMMRQVMGGTKVSVTR